MGFCPMAATTSRSTRTIANLHTTFVPSFLYSYQRYGQSRLWAKKSTKKQPTSAGGGGGFGASSKLPSENKKLRSLSSGQAGSGTKALRKAANTFDALRKAGGSEACNDVYVRAPLNSPTTYWFVGKIAVTTPSAKAFCNAAIAQKRLILEYSKQELRPQNLGGQYSQNLELWLAPGDSEMDVVQNKINLTKVVGSANDLDDDFDVQTVGYNPEIYVGEEREKGGLRIERDEEGRPVKPVFEVNQSA